MEANLMIPVYEIGIHTFEYKGKVISVKEFNDIAYDYTNGVGKKVSNYMNYRWGRQQFVEDYNPNKYGKNYTTVDVTEGEGYRLYDTETILLSEEGEDIDENFFFDHVKDGEMSILLIDINPNNDKISDGAEGELKFWKEDSDRILKDETLDTKMKLKTLPKAHFCVETSKGLVKLGGCKLIEMFKKKNHPYKFAILIEKITFINKKNIM